MRACSVLLVSMSTTEFARIAPVVKYRPGVPPVPTARRVNMGTVVVASPVRFVGTYNGTVIIVVIRITQVELGTITQQGCAVVTNALGRLWIRL